jgi:hypothetical protein
MKSRRIWNFYRPWYQFLSQLARRLKRYQSCGAVPASKGHGHVSSPKLPLLLCKSVKDNGECCLSTRAPTLFDMAVAAWQNHLPPVRHK